MKKSVTIDSKETSTASPATMLIRLLCQRSKLDEYVFDLKQQGDVHAFASYHVDKAEKTNDAVLQLLHTEYHYLMIEIELSLPGY